MLSISNMGCNLLVDFGFRFASPPIAISPPDAGALITSARGSSQGGSSDPASAVRSVFFEDGAQATTRRSERASLGSVPLVMSAESDSLRKSGGLAPGGSGGQLRDVLSLVKSGVGELFPANKITTRCSGCGCVISGGLGYMHYNIGRRKTYCKSCHVGQGLPVREPVIY